ncbi:hypothetical protein CLIB1423_15S03576 [[Candida] railenensis]|uniref:Uncharacterized protein n=1 Tax=[Candida] railenensis TaxID=45579 RepID=A0A9P0QSX2_9ASCO|nr:hypothetical protein CLIB1423_15S03576 [[Candida] railenensis]
MKFITLAALSALVASTYATDGLTDCYWEGTVQYCYYEGELGVVVPSASPDSGVTSYATCYTKVGKIICLNDRDDKVVWYEGTDAASVASTATANDYTYTGSTSANSASSTGTTSASTIVASTTAIGSNSTTDSTTSSSDSSSTSAAASSSASSSAASGSIMGVPSALGALLAVALASLY